MKRRAPLAESLDWREAIRSHSPAGLRWLARLAFGRPEGSPVHSEVLQLAREVASMVDLGQNDYIHVASYNAVNGNTIKATPVDPGSVRELPAIHLHKPGRSEPPIATLHISGKLRSDSEQEPTPAADRYYSVTFGVVPLTDGRRLIQVDTLGFFGVTDGLRAGSDARNGLEQLFVGIDPDLADKMRRLNVGYLDAAGNFTRSGRDVNMHAFNSDWVDAVHKISSSDAPDAHFSIENGFVEEQYFSPWKTD